VGLNIRGETVREITFEVPITPRGQARVRASAVRTASGKHIAVAYKDSTQRREEEKLAALIARHCPPEPFTGPLMLEVTAYLPLPHMSKKKAALSLGGALHHVTKPDLDNIVKHLLDVLRGMVYRDDKQIVSIAARKQYGDPPRWYVSVCEL
jgi:Holliday junction resolvase RusA-like endonuclease